MDAFRASCPNPSTDDTGRPYVEFPEGCFSDCVEINLVWVNPETKEIDDNPALNTHFQVWLEGGGWFDTRKEDWGNPEDRNPWLTYHDINLDCGGDSLEEALLKLADLVQEHYGEDGTFYDAAGNRKA